MQELLQHWDKDAHEQAHLDHSLKQVLFRGVFLPGPPEGQAGLSSSAKETKKSLELITETKRKRNININKPV